MSQPPANDPAVTAEQVRALSDALAQIVSDAQTYLGLGTPASGPTAPNDPPTTTLVYDYQASVAIQLDGDWEVFDSFVLNSAYLELSLNGYAGVTSEMALAAYVEATCTIAGIVFDVSGELPDLQSDRETDFTFTLRVANVIEGVSAQDFLTAFPVAPSYAAMTASLDADVRQQLDIGDNSCVGQVTMVVHRNADKSFYLQKISFDLQAGFDWKLNDDITVRRVAFTANATRPTNTADWQFELGVQGTVLLGEKIVSATALVSLGDASTLTLGLDVTATETITGPQLMDFFVPGASERTSQLVVDSLPPRMIAYKGEVDSVKNPLTAKVVFTKDAQPEAYWQLSSIDLKIFLSGVLWNSNAKDDNNMLKLTLGDLFFSLQARLVTTQSLALVPVHDPKDMNRDRGTLVTTRSYLVTTTYDYKGEIGGVLSLFNSAFRLAVLVKYDSTTGLTTFMASLPDGIYGPLNMMAADPAFNPALTAPANLLDTAEAAPAPTESTVSLDSVVDPIDGTERGLRIIFSETELSRATLKADFRLEWALTTYIKLTDLGILFDIKSPQDKAARTTSGYVYGKFQIGSGVQLLAIVAGTKTPTAAAFWAGISVAAAIPLPDGPLQIAPSAVLSDPAFVGQAVPSGGWGLPPFPMDVAQNVLSSVNAYLLIELVKIGDTSSTKMSSLKARASGEGTWNIYAGVQATGNLTLDVVIKTDSTTSQFVGHAELGGSCTIGTAPNQYTISFTGYVERGPNAPFSYSLKFSIVSVASGTFPPPTTIATLAPFGENAIDTSKLTGKLPDGYPISPTTLIGTASNSLVCTVQVQQAASPATGYTLERLTFRLEHQSQEWQIVKNSSLVVLKYASLELNIDSPGSNPTYGLVAYGLVSISNSVNLEARIQLLTSVDDPNRAGWLKVAMTVSAGVQGQGDDLLKRLVGSSSDFSLPISWPLDPVTANASFDLNIYFRKDSNSDWQLTEVDFTLYAATASQEWKVGPDSHQLPVASLWIAANFTNIDVSTVRVVSFNGIVNLSQRALAISAVLSGSDLSITIAAGSDFQSLVAVYIDNGLNNSSLAAPIFETQTTLDTYKSGLFADAVLKFHTANGVYSVDSINAHVNAVGDWIIVDNILSLTKLQLTLSLTSVGNNKWDFYANLYSEIRYRKQNGQYDIVKVNLKATLDHLTMDVELNCSIFDIFYIATAGRWTLDVNFFPRVKRLFFDMNWKDGRAQFQGQTFDWNLSDNYPNLLGMQLPTLEVNISRASSRLEASGVVSGVAAILNVHIPISYDLANGPLKIFNLDVDKIYEMCKKLYDLIKDIERICEIMLDIVGLGGALEVGLALVTITNAVSAVWKAIKKVFGYGDDDDDDGSPDRDGDGDSDKTDSDSSDSGKDHPGTYAWVIGGPGLSNGIASEETNFTIYPKDKLGLPLPINSADLTVTIIQNGVVISTIRTFTGIMRGGYIVSYVRPANLGDYTITISYPVALPGAPGGYTSTHTVTVTTAAAVLSGQNSILDVSQNLLAGVINYATIWPRDNFNRPRRGYDESESFNVAFEPPLPAPETYTFYNDSVKVGFVLPEQVGATYTMTATLRNGDTPLSGSPATFTSILVVDPNRCIAGGLGLSSGLAGEDTTFSVSVNDQMGRAWVGNMSCTATYVVQGEGTVVTLTSTQAGNVFRFNYTRPVIPETFYTLRIFVNGRLLPDYPIMIQTAVQAVHLSVTNSFLSLNAGPYYQTSNIVATITAFDDLAQPGLWRDTAIAVNFALTSKNVVSGATTNWPLVDRGDGTCVATLSLPDLVKYEIAATSSDGRIIVNPSMSPLVIEITLPPYVADSRCFGPGLSLPDSQPPAGTTTYFDIVPLDQYGKTMRLSTTDPTSFLVFMKEEARPVITPYNGSRRVTYTIPASSPLVPGDIIRVQLNGSDVSGSPYALTRTTPTVPANCRVSEWISHEVEEISSFVITAADANGNARRVGGDQVQVTSADADPNWPFVVLNIRDRGDGTYLVRYIPSVSVLRMNVLVNNVAINASPFSFPVPPVRFTAAGTGLDLSSLGIESQFQLFATDGHNPIDDSAFLHTAIIYPKPTAVLTAVPMTIVPVTPPPLGVSNATYTIPTTMPTGDYLIRPLINYRDIVSGSPFTVVVDDTPGATAVGIDNVYFATSSAGAFSGSFTVLTTPPMPVQVSDLAVTNAGQSTLPADLLPTYLVAVDQTQVGVFTIQTGFRIEGSWAVSIVFKGTPVLPPPNLGSRWVFYSCDAGKALASYVPDTPTPSFSIAQQTGFQIQVGVATRSLKFLKDPNVVANDRYSSATWKLPVLDMGSEVIFHFRTRWNVLSQASQLQMILPTVTQFSRTEVAVLRYYQGTVWWAIRNYQKDTYTNVTASAISANQMWHFLYFHLTPTSLRIYEDGHLVIAKDRRLLNNIPSYTLGFQVFDDAAAFDADVAEFVTSPAALHEDFSALSRPLEILFNKASQQINQSWYSIQQNPPIPIAYTDNGSLQIATTNQAVTNSNSITGFTAPLGPYCAVQYRFRINRSDGYESKVTLVAAITMRVLSGQPQWQLPTPYNWTTLSNTTAIRVGSGNYVTVSIIVSPNSLILFENGVMNFEYTAGGGGTTNSAMFDVQHYDARSGVDVELSFLRVLSGTAWP
ncbi:hypothetical protein OIDMADRAFT_62205 [Oidiodendron maius Zn]|uniref:Uncharacterized protein n=1 Tax=Oidiodendron maius (strain Zn) TaxID=913774 RepID=A0A0C3GQM5_OIDMZ|nr:hypothetical protein OIDMADRAFT_62205 [Oidiodendron maius Zn]